MLHQQCWGCDQVSIALHNLHGICSSCYCGVAGEIAFNGIEEILGSLLAINVARVTAIPPHSLQVRQHIMLLVCYSNLANTACPPSWRASADIDLPQDLSRSGVRA